MVRGFERSASASCRRMLYGDGPSRCGFPENLAGARKAAFWRVAKNTVQVRFDLNCWFYYRLHDFKKTVEIVKK
jgi:hypothetical protein